MTAKHQSYCGTSTKPEISVGITLAKKEFRLGDPMELRIEVTNIGQKAILVPNHLSLFSGEEAYLEIELNTGKVLVSPHMGFVVDSFPSPSKNKKSPTEIVLGSFVLLPPGTSFVQRIALFDYLSVRKYELKSRQLQAQGLLFLRRSVLSACVSKPRPERGRRKVPTV